LNLALLGIEANANAGSVCQYFAFFYLIAFSHLQVCGAGESEANFEALGLGIGGFGGWGLGVGERECSGVDGAGEKGNGCS